MAVAGCRSRVPAAGHPMLQEQASAVLTRQHTKAPLIAVERESDAASVGGDQCRCSARNGGCGIYGGASSFGDFSPRTPSACQWSEGHGQEGVGVVVVDANWDTASVQATPPSLQDRCGLERGACKGWPRAASEDRTRQPAAPHKHTACAPMVANSWSYWVGVARPARMLATACTNASILKQHRAGGVSWQGTSSQPAHTRVCLTHLL